MKKTYNTPKLTAIDIQTNDIMNMSYEGFLQFEGIGNGNEQGFIFPSVKK
jgi:hypothetical protein